MATRMMTCSCGAVLPWEQTVRVASMRKCPPCGKKYVTQYAGRPGKCTYCKAEVKSGGVRNPFSPRNSVFCDETCHSMYRDEKSARRDHYGRA